MPPETAATPPLAPDLHAKDGAVTRHEALLDRLLGALRAESFEALLAEGAAALGALAESPCAAAFLIEANHVLAEGWHPGPPDEGSALGPTLRSIALESVRQGRAVTLPADAERPSARVLLLGAGGRTVGAACVVEGPAGAEPVPARTLERAAQLVAEAIEARRRREAERAVARQQERWFHQLDRQVRVLDRERQKFAAVTNQGDTYVFVTDAAGAIRWVNRAMNDRWPPGDAESGWVGQVCREVCTRLGSDGHGDACRSCPVTRAIESNGPVHHELREVSGDRASTLYMSALPIKGLDGRAQEVIVMIQDLTDLETLRESEERYRVVTQGASDGIITVDETGRIAFANEAIERIFGWPPAELLGQPLTRLMAPEYAARHRVGFERYMQSGRRGIPWNSIQLPGRHRDGHEIQLEMTFGESLRDGRRLITGVMRDVTERKRAERELQQARERLGIVVSNSPIVLFAVDRDGIFTLSEGRGLQTLGFAPGEVVGRSAYELYAGVPRVIDNLKRALSGEEFTDHVEVGSLVFETRHTPVRDASGAVTGMIGVATDVTERRRLEAQLVQSQKMEAVGRLAGGVAHDFNNLLTSILGYCTLLMRRQTGDEEPDPRLVEIQRAAERGAGLTRQLLAFSRKQVIESRASDLNRLIADMEDMLRRLIGEDVNLRVVLAPGGAPIQADAGQLEQVLMNLIINARDAMPRGGNLTIEIACQDLEAARVSGATTVPPGA
jgi:PAS domain S-box-containing protein